MLYFSPSGSIYSWAVTPLYLEREIRVSNIGSVKSDTVLPFANGSPAQQQYFERNCAARAQCREDRPRKLPTRYGVTCFGVIQKYCTIKYWIKKRLLNQPQLFMKSIGMSFKFAAGAEELASLNRRSFIQILDFNIFSLFQNKLDLRQTKPEQYCNYIFLSKLFWLRK